MNTLLLALALAAQSGGTAAPAQAPAPPAAAPATPTAITPI
jgi:hypothetical protein